MGFITQRVVIGGKPLRFLRARKSMLLFIILFTVGIWSGSIYAAVSGSDSLLATIVLNDLQIQATRSFRQLFFKSAVQSLGILVYLYFCSNCSKGKPLIYLVPLFLGLSSGGIITAILAAYTAAALPYVLLCIVLPRFILAVLLISACGNALKISAQLFQDPGEWRRSQGSCIHMGLYTGAFLLFSFLESLLITFFRHFLP